MGIPLRVLIVEDSEPDLLLILRELRRGGYNPVFERVETKKGMQEALQNKDWDVILADHRLPHFNSLEALELVKKQGLDLPFIIVSGTIGEELAVTAMKAGAHDYVMKEKLSRLVPVVGRELQEVEQREKRKQAEAALRESEEKYRQVVENANEAIFVSQDRVIKFFNPKTVEIFGHSKEDLSSAPFLKYIHPEDRGLVMERHQKRLKGEDLPHVYPFRIVDEGGKIKWVEINAVIINWEGNPATLNFLNDITNRKKTEENILHAKEEWERTFDSIPDQIAIVDHEFRISRANRAMADRLGLHPREMIGGHCYELIHGLQEPPSYCPHSQVLAEGKEVFTEFWESRLEGHFLLTVSPLCGSDGKPGGVIHVLRDITDKKKAEEKVIEEGKKLQKAIEGIIQVMASTVEAKDSYTASHQRRVANLALAIAKEMGLSEIKLEGIFMAGMIHDLGKISIPAEILSKPNPLTALEISLIKIHPRAGYDILKDIDFPWPIARIILQHHERTDGSGYPEGLSGEDILDEAKILAVADVVEAIASHRPYRPAQGIDKALDEISKNKGIFYDPQVVEACVKLFQEKGFQFE